MNGKEKKTTPRFMKYQKKSKIELPSMPTFPSTHGVVKKRQKNKKKPHHPPKQEKCAKKKKCEGAMKKIRLHEKKIRINPLQNKKKLHEMS